jgi:hypothetical protein
MKLSLQRRFTYIIGASILIGYFIWQAIDSVIEKRQELNVGDISREIYLRYIIIGSIGTTIAIAGALLIIIYCIYPHIFNKCE